MNRTRRSRLLLSLFLFSWAAATAGGCSCVDEAALDLETPVLHLDLEPRRIEFGAIVEGRFEVQHLEVGNRGRVDLHVTPTIAPESSAEFTTPPQLLTVAAGGSAQLEVQFDPVGAGEDDGTLVLTTDDPASPEVRIELHGGPISSALVAYPDPVAFSPAEASIVRRNVDLRNDGKAFLHITAVGIDVAGNPDFSLETAELPREIRPGDTFALTVVYSRSTRAEEGTLLVLSDDPADDGTDGTRSVRLLPDALGSCGNDLDDDGDGLVDFPDDPGCEDPDDDSEENPPACSNGAEQVCGEDTGECRAGLRSCTGGQWGPCDGAIAGTDELCDGLDNDCDAEMDEGISEVCPAGGCTGARACVANSGVPGGQWTACVPVGASTELCDLLDNDCNGQIDEGVIEPCVVNGCAGQRICVPGTGAFTDCQPADPQPEVCDGLDNDCDGGVDENAVPTVCGVGECAREVTGCTGGIPDVCTPGTPVVELCDGLDNDCNGIPDDGLGAWSDWSDTSSCSGGNCDGTGSKTQQRTCDAPAPGCSGASCFGPATQTVSCDMPACPPCSTPWGATVLNGATTTAYETSSVACGGGCSSEARVCVSGVLSGSFSSEACAVQTRDGGWSAWSDASSCGGAACGGLGSKTQQRTCDNPAPGCGGASCAGPVSQIVACSMPACPLDCSTPWGAWVPHGGSVTGYQASSVACGGACSSEVRACTNGVLSGSFFSETCAVQTRDGGWGGWVDASSCGGGPICGGVGLKTQQRACDNPSPGCGGAACSGPATQEVACNIPACLDCSTPWGPTVLHGGTTTAYQASSVACGGACSSEVRACTNGVLSGSFSSEACAVQTRDGGWSAWSDASSCGGGACDGLGSKTQQRTCDNPAPGCGGASCAGPATQIVACSMPACPLDCSTPWGAWVSHGGSVTAYQASSVACGGACSSEVRTCTNGVLSGSFFSATCAVQTRDGGWSAWSDASSCGGGACGGVGSKTQQRTCDNPAPGCGGASCAGPATQTVACSMPACLDCSTPWGAWVPHGGSVTGYQSPLVSCSGSCAQQLRTCNNGVLSGTYGNQFCGQQACVAPTPYCSGGACVQCTGNAHCGTYERCQGNQCVPCTATYTFPAARSCGATYCQRVTSVTGATATFEITRLDNAAFGAWDFIPELYRSPATHLGNNASCFNRSGQFSYSYTSNTSNLGLSLGQSGNYFARVWAGPPGNNCSTNSTDTGSSTISMVCQ